MNIMNEKDEISRVSYGILWQKMAEAEKRLAELKAQIEVLEKKVLVINSTIDKSKGGFNLIAFAFSIGASVSALITYLIDRK